jgi:hypothetical protein
MTRLWVLPIVALLFAVLCGLVLFAATPTQSSDPCASVGAGIQYCNTSR